MSISVRNMKKKNTKNIKLIRKESNTGLWFKVSQVDLCQQRPRSEVNLFLTILWPRCLFSNSKTKPINNNFKVTQPSLILGVAKGPSQLTWVTRVNMAETPSLRLTECLWMLERDLCLLIQQFPIRVAHQDRCLLSQERRRVRAITGL